MTMIVAVDAMAKRYSLLPSEILTRASTFDLVIMDAALGFENYQRDLAEGKKPVPSMDQKSMFDMISKARNETNS